VNIMNYSVSEEKKMSAKIKEKSIREKKHYVKLLSEDIADMSLGIGAYLMLTQYKDTEILRGAQKLIKLLEKIETLKTVVEDIEKFLDTGEGAFLNVTLTKDTHIYYVIPLGLGIKHRIFLFETKADDVIPRTFYAHKEKAQKRLNELYNKLINLEHRAYRLARKLTYKIALKGYLNVHTIPKVPSRITCVADLAPDFKIYAPEFVY